jgi:hypothetical protein
MTLAPPHLSSPTRGEEALLSETFAPVADLSPWALPSPSWGGSGRGASQHPEVPE